MTDDVANLLEDTIAKALKAGADSADAVFISSAGLNHALRLGKIEKLERAESADLGLRVFCGKRQAMTSSTDLAAATLDGLVEAAVAMARAAPEDPHCGIAEPDRLAREYPTLDIIDDAEPSAEAMIEMAREAEDAARAVDGVTNSEGAEAGWSRTEVRLATSAGFAGDYARTYHSLSVSVIAGEGLGKERDYDYTVAVFGLDMIDAAKLGAAAGSKAVARLNPRKSDSGRYPVLYDPREGGSLLRHLGSAIAGPSVARGTSFLKDRLDQQVFARGVTVIDDPHRARGLSSKPFDGEGLPNRRMNIVDDGRLTTWLLDLRSARQLGLAPTGHAARRTSSPPSPGSTNLWLAPGEISRDAMIGDVKAGLYVTELIGMGVNGVTGDYSRGAAGFWIENGELTHPVSEITIAGNLKDMFLNLTPADDLTFRYSVNAPTVRVDGMTVAGV